MTTMIEHKRGDTFKLTVTLTEDDGITPVDITGWTIRSHIRYNRHLISELTYTAVNEANGEYLLTATDTTDWPIVKAEIDLEYTDLLGAIRSSDTFRISIIKDITYD